MATLQREALTAIVQDDAGFRRYETGAEAVEDRIDEAHGITVFIDNRDVDGVAMKRHLEIRKVGEGARQIDPGRQVAGEVF